MGDDCRISDEKDPEENDEAKPSSPRNWFLSLSRRKKTNSNSTNLTRVSSETNLRKSDKKSKKDDRNVFQRLKRKMEKKFPSRQRKHPTTSTEQQTFMVQSEDIESTTTAEWPSTLQPLPTEKYDHRKYLAKKWLEIDTGPNLIMFQACTEMLSHAWYWGEISRHDAQRQLTDKPNGSFLVRDSETDGAQFTLSFRIGNCTLHYRIQHRDNYWHFEARQYESIVEMIEDIMLRSTDEKFICYVKAPCEMQPPFPVILKYPISRYSKIAQLQDLCRRVLQRNLEPAEIENLPIPMKLRQYLAQKTSFIF